LLPMRLRHASAWPHSTLTNRKARERRRPKPT
jgi:hypothetical protein